MISIFSLKRLPISKSIIIGLFIYISALVLYIPFTPKYASHSPLSVLAEATDRVCIWIGTCIVLSYMLHTSRLVRSTSNGRYAYWMMWWLYGSLLLFMILLYLMLPSDEIDADPFWG
jgi:predicted membrane-bound spermidine synthase